MHRIQIATPPGECESHLLPESESIIGKVQPMTLRHILPSGGLDVTCALPDDLASIVELTPWAATARAELPELFNHTLTNATPNFEFSA